MYVSCDDVYMITCILLSARDYMHICARVHICARARTTCAATLEEKFFAYDLDLHLFGFFWVCGQGTPRSESLRIQACQSVGRQLESPRKKRISPLNASDECTDLFRRIAKSSDSSSLRRRSARRGGARCSRWRSGHSARSLAIPAQRCL